MNCRKWLALAFLALVSVPGCGSDEALPTVTIVQNKDTEKDTQDQAKATGKKSKKPQNAPRAGVTD